MKVSTWERGKGTRPAYMLVGWRVAHRDNYSLTYRPGVRALMGRLGWTLVAVVVAVIVHQSIAELGPIRSGGASQMSTQQASQAPARESRLREETARLDRVLTIAHYAAQGAIGALLAFGILLPLSCFWSSVTLTRGMRGELVVRQRGVLLPSTRTWPKGAFGRMMIVASETVLGRAARRHRAGYRWTVSLEAAGGGSSPEFCPHHQKTRPLEGQLPERVADLVGFLGEITGLPASAPVVVDWHGQGYGGYSTPIVRQRRTVSMGDPVVTRQTFHSLDDMPEHLRGRAEELLARSREQGGTPQEEVVSTRQTFHSLDEMPPELRARVEKMMGGETDSLAAESSQTITITDGDGTTRTYSSPDEMPPDVRAMFERMRRGRG